MRYFYLLLFSFFLFFRPSLSAQKTDSATTVNRTSQDSVRQLVIREFDRYRDSMEALRIRQNVQKNGKSLDAFLQEVKERENAERRQLYFRIGLGVAFLAALALAFARWRRTKS